MTYLAIPLQAALLVLVLTAAAFDLHSRRIPNWLVAAGWLTGVALQAWLGGWGGLAIAGKGTGLAALIYLPLFVLRGTSGGDVKLMGAVGALVGPMNWLIVFCFAAVLGGLVALVVILVRSRVGETLRNIAHIVSELARFRAPHASRPDLVAGDERSISMPHGAVIAVACILLLLAVRGGARL